MSAIDDLTPVPDQPEISEGNQAFHQKAYALYKWLREKHGPAIIESYNMLVNAVTGAFTSVTSDSITMASSGDLSFAIGLNKSFVPGTPTRLAYVTDPTKYVDGVCKTYDKTTGAFVLTASGMNGSGTYNNWSVSIIPSAGGGLASLLTNKFTGLQTFANEVTIASATTIDLTAAGSNQFKLTGTVPVEGATMPQGAVINGRAAGATPLINSASFKVQGGADYTCAPGDWLEVKKDTDGNVHVSITPVSGKAIISPKNSTNDSTFSSTSSNDTASPNWVKGMSLGWGQTWQNVTASRAKGTTYTNSTNKPIAVLISQVDGTSGIRFNINGNIVASAGNGATGADFVISAIILPGETYSLANQAGAISRWWELRA